MATWGPTKVVTADDGYEEGGGWSANGVYCGVGLNGGFRFVNVNVPQGASVSTATLTIYERSNSGSLADIVSTFYGDDVDNAAVWASDTSMPSQVTQTTASVSLNAPATWVEWTARNLNVTGIVAEIVARAGWSANNAMRFAWMGTGSSSSAFVRAYDVAEDSNYGATLTIEYTAGATPVESTPSDSMSTSWTPVLSLLLPLLLSVGEASASYTDAIAPLEAQQYVMAEGYSFHGNVPYADTPSAMEPILCVADDSNDEYTDDVSAQVDDFSKEISIGDSLSPEDSTNSILDMLAGIADIHGPPEDAVNVVESEVAELSDSASDGWDDASDYAFILSAILSDDNAPDDAVSVLEPLILEPSDSEDFTDSISRTEYGFAEWPDSVTASVEEGSTLKAEPSDSISYSESLNALFVYKLTLSDSEDFSDTVLYGDGLEAKNVTLDDSFTPTDDLGSVLGAYYCTISEDADNSADSISSASGGIYLCAPEDDADNYADAVLCDNSSKNVTMDDSLAPEDALSGILLHPISLSDDNIPSDVLSLLEPDLISFGDSVSPSDSVTAEVEDVLVTSNPQDSFEFAEQVSAQVRDLASIADSNEEYSETVSAVGAVPKYVELADEFAPADAVSVFVNTGSWRDAVSFEKRLTGPAWRDEVGYDLVTGGFSVKYAIPSDSLSWADSANYAWPVTVSLWDTIQPYIHLQWDANAETDIDYYNVYWSESAGIDKDNAATYDGVINAGNVTDYVFTDKAAGTYYFAITAVNTGAEESDESNEISSSLAAQDSISYRNPIPVTIAESWTTTDRTPSYIKNDFYVTEEIRVGIGEALAPVDSVQADWGPKYVNISESIATSDDLSILLVKFSSVSESFVPTDTVATSGPQVPVLLSDTLNFWTDAVRFQKNNILVVEVKQAEIEESFDTSDSVSYSLIPYSVRVNAADSWTPSDAVSHGIGYAHSIADSFTPTDTVQFENIEVGGAWPKSYEPSDTWTPSDSVSAQLNHLAAIGDQLNPLDHVHPSFGYGPPAEVFISMQTVNDVHISFSLVKDVIITRWPTQ